MKKGEIWRVRLPHIPGHAQSGGRLAIIVQNDVLSNALPVVTVIPLTGAAAARRFPCTLEIVPDAGNGLAVRSHGPGISNTSFGQVVFCCKLGTLQPPILDQVIALIDQLVK